jgi:hypothetical protein
MNRSLGGVTPEGRFLVGVHRPAYRVINLREKDSICELGVTGDGRTLNNRVNFPENDVTENQADWVYEIPNAFPFRGVTYIAKRWADRTANRPEKIRLPAPPEVSLGKTLRQWAENRDPGDLIALLPEPLQLALAVTSTDPGDLVRLAGISCDIWFDETSGRPRGLYHVEDGKGKSRPKIKNEKLFEAVANNSCLPDDYKRVMVLRPGAQGNSEITAEWRNGEEGGHVFEYLRRNSYIPWGHYAANMGDDAVRYRISDLKVDDVRGMRHLYYQRTFVRLAGQLGLELPQRRHSLSEETLEHLRLRILEAVNTEEKADALFLDATVWGWNFGFDYAPSHYRLHASHQQVHQQYALSPAMVDTQNQGKMPSYSSGDLVAAFIRDYFEQTGRSFFEDYLRAIETNTRTDGGAGEADLSVFRDDHVILFVPKAQTSQWELQLMPLRPVANILEADAEVRRSLDEAIHKAMTVLTRLGARMITTIEYSGRISAIDAGQRLVYCFLPRLPESPGAFSESQLRWINGHYPEDFAAACRMKLKA